MFQFTSLLAAALLATRVAGHGAVTSYSIGGTTYPGYTGFSPASSPPTIEWQWPDYNPTLDPSDSKVMCNGGTSAPLSATIAAGSKITAFWAQWTHVPGSVSVYLYKCSGAFSSCTGGGAGWFKIDEAGLLSGTMYDGVWGLGTVDSTKQWTSTIPPQLAPGNYLIRHELIAVHQTNTPQFYAECAQLVITGSGSSSPTSEYLVAIPGYAKLSDANVKVDIYSEAAKTTTCWDVPGPPVWGGVSYSTTGNCNGGSTGSSTTTKPASSSAGVSTSKTSSSTKPASTSSTATGGAALYGQCGGTGWMGPTTCSQGTCKVSNQFYSQCLP